MHDTKGSAVPDACPVCGARFEPAGTTDWGDGTDVTRTCEACLMTSHYDPGGQLESQERHHYRELSIHQRIPLGDGELMVFVHRLLGIRFDLQADWQESERFIAFSRKADVWQTFRTLEELRAALADRFTPSWLEAHFLDLARLVVIWRGYNRVLVPPGEGMYGWFPKHLHLVTAPMIEDGIGRFAVLHAVRPRMKLLEFRLRVADFHLEERLLLDLDDREAR